MRRVNTDLLGPSTHVRMLEADIEIYGTFDYLETCHVHHVSECRVGNALLSSLAGPYVAIWREREVLYVLPSPDWGRNLYFSSHSTDVFLSSNVADQFDQLRTVAVNYAFLENFVSGRMNKSSATGWIGIQKIPVGYLLQVDSQGVHFGAMWPAMRPKRILSLNEFVDAALATLTRAVHRDPSILLLSGGWDSSLLALVAQGGGSKRQIEGLHFFDARFGLSDERGDVNNFARITGLTPRQVDLGATRHFSILSPPKLPGTPEIGYINIAAELVVDEMAGRATVLTGHGGDAVFREEPVVRDLPTTLWQMGHGLHLLGKLARVRHSPLLPLVRTYLRHIMRADRVGLAGGLGSVWSDIARNKEEVANRNDAFESKTVAPFLGQQFLELVSCLPSYQHVGDRKRPVEVALFRAFKAEGLLRHYKGFEDSSVVSNYLHSRSDVDEIIVKGHLLEHFPSLRTAVEGALHDLAIGDGRRLGLVGHAFEAEMFLRDAMRYTSEES